MQLTFLGTGAAAPTLARNVSSLALRLPRRGETWLFDCGEGTQHQLLLTTVKIARIARIFISHLHGDHLFGLLGLMATRELPGEPRPLDLYGPPGLEEYVRSAQRLSYTYLGYPLRVHQAEAGVVYEDEQFRVRCAPLAHRVPAFGYRVEERDRPGRFLAERAAALGLPAGPIFGALKRGERVELPDGRQVDGAGLVGPPERGRSLAYCTDTAYTERAVALADGVDLLVHEATFAERDAEMARLGGHSTAAQAARVARAAGVGRLVLTHISARYANGEPGSEALLAEARAVFPNTDLAADLRSFELPRHR